MTNIVVRPRRSSKALLKAKLPPKKGHSHCLIVCCLSDPLQLSESRWNHYIWEVCSANQWEARKTATPAVGTGQQNGTHSSPQQCLTTSHNEHVASSMNWTKFKVLPHLPYSPDLSPTDYYFIKHLINFLQGKCFHNQEDAENAFQEFIESWSMVFMLQE